MSTAAVSSNSIYQELQSFFSERRSDLQKLGKDLKSGDLTAAQQDYQTLQSLGQSGPFADGGPFAAAQREQDFQNIGTALQSGDLAGAKQALMALHQTFVPVPSTASSSSASTASPAVTPASTSSTDSTSSASGPEIVLNLGNVPQGEQITIGLSNGANGTEQVSISATNPQGQSTGEIMLNLAQNSNEQIVLNLFNSTASAAAQGNSVSVTA
jgi:hypothetical protein